MVAWVQPLVGEDSASSGKQPPPPPPPEAVDTISKHLFLIGVQAVHHQSPYDLTTLLSEP